MMKGTAGQGGGIVGRDESRAPTRHKSVTVSPVNPLKVPAQVTSTRPLRASDGTAGAISGKSLEEELRPQRDTLQKYLDVAGVMFVVINADETVALVNRRGCEILGYKQHEVVGKNWFDEFLPSRVRPQVRDVFARLMSGAIEPAECVENSVLTKDGRERIIAWHNAILRDENGTIVGTLSSGEDITDRRKAEEQSRLFRELVNRSSNLILILNSADGRIVDANEAVIQQLGYPRTEIKKLPFGAISTDRVGPSAPWRESLERLHRLGTSPVESLYRRADGQTFPVEVGFTITTHAGREYILAIARDITDRKMAEEALCESERKYRELFENAREAIMTLDLEGRITDINKLVEEYGFKREELIGKRLFEFVPEYGKARAISDFDALVGGSIVHGEMDVITPKGIFTVEYRDNPIVRAGEVVGVQAILTDITERKLAEEALQRGEKQLRMIADSIPAMVSHIGRDQRYRFANRVYEETFGIPQNQIVGLHIRDVLGPSTYAVVAPKVELALKGERVSYEYQLSSPRRGVGWLHVTYVPELGADGHIEGFYVLGTDITELKRAEEALRESEDKFKTLAEEAFDAIVIHDGDRVVEVNKAFARIWGCEPQRAVGVNVDEFVTKESLEMIRERIQSGYEKPYEVIGIRRDGTRFPLEITGKPVTYKGKPVRIVTARDITERKLAEEALQDGEERYRALVQSSSEHIFILNREGVYLSSNDRVGHLGLEGGSAIVGKSLDDVYSPDLAALYKEKLEEVFQTGLPVTFEHALEELDGVHSHLDTLYPLRRDDSIWAVGGICRDITDRKLAEQKVQEQLGLVQQLLDMVPMPIFYEDGAGRYVGCNRAFEQFVGLDARQIIGKTMYDLGPKEIADVYARRGPELAAHPGIQRYEGKIRDQGGQTRDVIFHKANIVDGQGGVTGLIGAISDITERKRLEQLLRESEKFVAKGHLAAQIAHEINNPLAGIKNAFLLLRDAVAQDHPYYRYLDMIDREIDRISRVIQETFNLYRPHRPSPQPFSIMHTVREVVSLLEAHWRSRGVNIVVEGDEQTADVVLPEDLVRQALYNLIKNAIEASSENQVVTVKAVNMGDSLEITVSDTGCGIPEAVQARIFEPFFSTKKSEDTTGLGIGLPSVKDVIQALEGTVEFQSKEGEGAVFRMSIPLRGVSKEVHHE